MWRAASSTSRCGRSAIEPGQRELTLRLKRWTNMNAQRWFSGDSHVHFLGANGAHREAQGEDLNVVNLLQSQWGHLFTNTEDFTRGRRRRTTADDRLLLAGEPPAPARPPDAVGLEGAGDAVVYRRAGRGGAGRHAGGDDVGLGGRLPRPGRHGDHPAPAEPERRAGRADRHRPRRRRRDDCRTAAIKHLEYYRYLNCGYRLPLVGGTDKMCSDVPVGLYRTYAYIPDDEEFTYDNWCRAVRAGRTFLSGGPMLHFTVDGAQHRRHAATAARRRHGGGGGHGRIDLPFPHPGDRAAGARRRHAQKTRKGARRLT